MISDQLLERIQSLPEGYTRVHFEGKSYGLTKTTFNEGKSFKIYAAELKGTDFISLNIYLTKKAPLLKPCEMPAEKVITFLEQMAL